MMIEIDQLVDEEDEVMTKMMPIPRQEEMQLQRTCSEIARFLNKDHATIIHYRNLHDDLMKTEAKYKHKFDKLVSAFRYEMVTGDAQQWRDFVDKANEAYDEHGWGVEMLQFLYEMKKV